MSEGVEPHARIGDDDVAFIQSVGNVIRELRTAADMTLKQLGDIVGMDRGMLSRLETCYRPQAFRLWHVTAVCRALVIEPAELFSRAQRDALPFGLTAGGAREEEASDA